MYEPFFLVLCAINNGYLKVSSICEISVSNTLSILYCLQVRCKTAHNNLLFKRPKKRGSLTYIEII